MALMLAVTAGLLAAPAAARRPMPASATPSALVATEIAFSRLAAQKGQRKAAQKFADDGAVLPVPGFAQSTQAYKRDVRQVWVSCDGTLGVTQGAQQKDGSPGSFITVWKRQKNGTYRWVIDQSNPAPLTGEAPDMVIGKVAACDAAGPQPEADKIVVTANSYKQQGSSEDGSLTWSVRADEPCVRYVLVRMRRQSGEPLSEVLAERIVARANAGTGILPGAACWG